MIAAITVTGVPDLTGQNATVATVMAIGVGLSAAVAALVVRGWGRDARSATGAALIYGFAPFVASIAVGYMDLMLMVIPPAVLILLNEVLIKRRQLAVFVGALAGYIASTTSLHTTPALVSICLSLAMGMVVFAMFRPSTGAISGVTLIQAGVGGVIAYVLATAYPLSFSSTGSRSWSLSVGDNGGSLRRLLDSVIPTGSGHFGQGGLGTYLVAGLLAAATVELLRRANLRWSLLPIGAAAVIVLMNLFPRFSVHL